MVELDPARNRAAGANDFMQKPFDTDRLMERCCDVLELERPVLS